MITVSSKSADYFGSIYQKAMKSQLNQIGSNLVALRKARNEDVNTVADAVDIAPGVLQSIESGNQDFQVKVLFALCEYYGAELDSVLGKGELISAKAN
jgi:transcriptional regulator with XRE-family HTH domain